MPELTEGKSPSRGTPQTTLRDARAEDIMTDDPMTAEPGTSVRDAMDRLAVLEIRHLPVIDDRERLLGMLSDRDFQQVSPHDPDRGAMLAQPVAHFISRAPISVSKRANIGDVVDVLISNRIGAVPVVEDDNTLAGMVSYVDVLRLVRRTLSG